jgi:hypothetical protein
MQPLNRLFEHLKARLAQKNCENAEGTNSASPKLEILVIAPIRITANKELNCVRAKQKSHRLFKSSLAVVPLWRR